MAAARAVRVAGRRSRRLFDIFVAEVPWTVSTKELKEYFSQFGSVQRCQLPFAIAEGVEVVLPPHAASYEEMDRDTGFHRRYCWIKFLTQQDVQNVLQKDSHVLEGAKLVLKQQPHRRRSQRKNQSE